jgi:CheY-like chemotaxis protein
MEGDREMCLQAGMDDYLGKPIKRPDLAASLVRASAAIRDTGGSADQTKS